MILSLQSSLTHGYVGNSAAVFALQRLGFDVCALNTVTFSNHPGYGRHLGRTTPAFELKDLVDGLEELGCLHGCRAVLSGYLGSAANGGVLLETVCRVATANPNSLFCCDPVMGDRAEGLYVDADIVSFFVQQTVAQTTILTPNHFELETLVGRRLPEMADAVQAAREIVAFGPRVVVVSSVIGTDLPDDTISTLAVEADAAWTVTTPLLADFRAKGTGDLLTALFLANVLTGRTTPDALSQSVSALFGIIHATARDNASELRLLSAQDRLVHPLHLFIPQRFQ